MGTTYHIKVVSEEIDSDELKVDVEKQLAHLNQVFSTYIPHSEISQLNREHGNLMVSEELMKVLSLSDEIHRRSKGAFDPTVGPLVELWGFGPSGPRDGVPSDFDIRKALALSGFENVFLRDNSIEKPEGMVIDLSAIAKGYAVDVISELLDGMGEHQYMVEIGGEVRAKGYNDRRNLWQIGIEAPDENSRRLLRVVPIKNMAMATSGDYRNFFNFRGQAYSHTLNPNTGWPVSHNMASVTVLHATAVYADGLATAFSVMGPTATMEFAEANKLLVLAIIREEERLTEITSSELDRYLAGVAEERKHNL